jgi:CRISPR-associated protein Cmr2
MTHLFIFTISPVQSFIGQARKTKDLYAGSQILSKLCRTGIESTKSVGGEIIFPYLDEENSNQSLPNRFIAKISKHSTLSFQEIGEKIEKDVKEYFEDEGTALLSSLGKFTTDFKNIFWKQIKGHLDIHWVIVPINDNEQYLDAFQRTERILGSVKNLRSFNQNPEKGRKCSLDGQNNALFFSHLYNKPSYANSAVKVYSGNFKKGEGLSAVSMLKRNYPSDKFSSTAQIALLQNEKDLKEEEKENLKNYKNLFTEKQYVSAVVKNGEPCKIENEDKWLDVFDYQLLFEENITDKTVPNESQRKCALQFLNKISRNFKDKYYAIIHFDGDKMGRWLSAKDESNNIILKENVKPEYYHHILSKSLSKFADWATDYLKIEDYNGQSIYAGGDDFLGFINLNSLVKVLTDLQREFELIVNKGQDSKGKKYLGEDEKPLSELITTTDKLTFSAGVVIAHYKDPLSLVLEQARNAEKVAKDKGNRNAFCIVASKGSGEIHQTCFKWDYLTEKTLPILDKVITWLSEEKISKKFIISFATEMRMLMEDGDYKIQSGQYQADIIKVELQRLMLRAKQNSTEKQVKDFSYELYKLLVKSKMTTDNFLQFLYICDFISRHITQNKPKLELA